MYEVTTKKIGQERGDETSSQVLVSGPPVVFFFLHLNGPENKPS